MDSSVVILCGEPRRNKQDLSMLAAVISHWLPTWSSICEIAQHQMTFYSLLTTIFDLLLVKTMCRENLMLPFDNHLRPIATYHHYSSVNIAFSVAGFPLLDLICDGCQSRVGS